MTKGKKKTKKHVKKSVKKQHVKKIIKKKAIKPVKKKVSTGKSKKAHAKMVKPSVRKSLDFLKQDLYGIKSTIESDTPEQKKIHLQTITFELAAIKQLMDRVLVQLKTVEEHLEEIKNR